MAVTGTDRMPTVVALRALGLGDLLCGLPALRALRRAFPDHRLVLAAPAWHAPFAAHAGVDEVVDTGPLEPLDPVLHHADIAVNLHGCGPQSTHLLAETSPRRLIAFARSAHDQSIERPAVWRSDEHEVRRWCRLLEVSGIAADATDIYLPAPLDQRREHTVVVHPGAAAPARRWPAERFGAVVAALVDRGHDIVLTGGAEERHLCKAVVAAAGPFDPGRIHIAAGETDLCQLAATIASAGLVIANDTGVAHLATAYRTPSVVLFGPTPPSEWGPPAGGPHIALWSGRRGEANGAELDPGLAQITVAQVLASTEGLVPDVVA